MAKGKCHREAGDVDTSHSLAGLRDSAAKAGVIEMHGGLPHYLYRGAVLDATAVVERPSGGCGVCGGGVRVPGDGRRI
jgi:hypothetical protein